MQRDALSSGSRCRCAARGYRPRGGVRGGVRAKEAGDVNQSRRLAAQNALPIAAPLSPLMRDFLQWVVHQPRSYADAMDAWRSSCPRFTIWEDALAGGLVREESGRGGTLGDLRVVLTPSGRALLDGG